ncbi:ribokinase [Prevotella denticola DNF00960]|jgi:ribokinase|uniref:ribokinase n=1 Tax=Prevotella denticola TaxID=28129 RepID=UPI000510439F|nr:ribokinase [Prevotella denticola]KGF41714.1 ribokinase [Prevotella denticola DNF00960]QUI93271.1 ribokinase [Prevotella denticola]
MNNKKIIVIVGSANTDMVISTDHFPLPGETLMGKNFMINYGGKGANQAVAAARMGGQTVFIGKVGDDNFGNSIITNLISEGININHLHRTQESPTGVALITTVPSGENSIIVNAGANGQLKAEDIQSSEDVIAQAGIVLMQLETPVATLIEAARLGKKHGAFTILNPAPAPVTPLPQELLENIDLLIPNETETCSISGVEIKDEDTAMQAINTIQKMGVKNIIITVGSKGAIAKMDKKLITVPAFKVKAIDTTAAGDTFCGALSVALSEGKDIEAAIRFGNKASSISVTRKGAQLSIPHRDELEM